MLGSLNSLKVLDSSFLQFLSSSVYSCTGINSVSSEPFISEMNVAILLVFPVGEKTIIKASDSSSVQFTSFQSLYSSVLMIFHYSS